MGGWIDRWMDRQTDREVFSMTQQTQPWVKTLEIPVLCTSGTFTECSQQHSPNTGNNRNVQEENEK